MSDIPKSTVEIGHTYAPNRLVKLNGPTQDFPAPFGYHFSDTPEAKKAREIAESFGAGVIRVALIDDVLMKQRVAQSEDVPRWILFKTLGEAGVVAGTGVSSSELYHESDYESSGRDIIAHIQVARCSI